MFAFPASDIEVACGTVRSQQRRCQIAPDRTLSKCYNQSETLGILLGDESECSELSAEGSRLEEPGGAGAGPGEGSQRRVRHRQVAASPQPWQPRLGDSPHHSRCKFYIWKLL